MPAESTGVVIPNIFVMRVSIMGGSIFCELDRWPCSIVSAKSYGITKLLPYVLWAAAFAGVSSPYLELRGNAGQSDNGREN
jgi:hypothetical protein